MDKKIYLLSPTPAEGAVHLPMIEFKTIDQQIDFKYYDALIFTSKQGVIALDEITKGEWRETPAAAIGEMTAKEIKSRGGKVLYVASKAYGETLAKELRERFSNYRWLYPRPKVVASKIAQELESAGVEVAQRVIYETVCKDYSIKERPEKGAVLIFTSPSIVKCFLRNFSWHESYIAVAIGKKTEEAYAENNK
ncbi:MAG: uroporphyrinogen-III synthase, partial [Hydrogenimonas sp.]|nr:uroporphyrinogen-III synthase [Hydrogenimonas sp.]